MNTTKIALIPAYEPNKNLIDLVQTLNDQGLRIVIVDDGSQMPAQDIFRQCADMTVDADGQHLPKDVARVLSQAEEMRGTLILGGRRFNGKVPLRSRLGGALTRTVFRLSSGMNLL